MTCAVHTDREATGYCRNCGKALCPECTREIRGALPTCSDLTSLRTPQLVASASAPFSSPHVRGR